MAFFWRSAVLCLCRSWAWVESDMRTVWLGARHTDSQDFLYKWKYFPDLLLICESEVRGARQSATINCLSFITGFSPVVQTSGRAAWLSAALATADSQSTSVLVFGLVLTTRHTVNKHTTLRRDEIALYLRIEWKIVDNLVKAVNVTCKRWAVLSYVVMLRLTLTYRAKLGVID